MKILATLFPKFTAIDLIGPANTWMFIPNVEIQLAAAKPGAVPTDIGLTINATHDFETCFQEPDVLLVPGGGIGAFQALQDDEFIDQVARLGAKAGWVTSVCNGSLLLGAAGLLRGYKAGCHWYSRDYLRKFGAEPLAERIVVDRNRATGGGMTAGIDFALSMMGRWGGEPAGQLAELCLEYAPCPPFKTGLPDLAPPGVLAMANEILAREMPNSVADETAKRRGFVG
ncbi:DJ-1/PfpI family protein [Acidovorax sp.]|uniref:DJ-1/PfpI family protein n=1 Tax=Acidovorax sp. TaxID=1872122 RepID=UPI002634DCAC|nr:DJ-1/PfpI family protein [Acidovorax sp.]